MYSKLMEDHGYSLMEPIGHGGFSCCFKVLSHKYNDYFVAKIIEINGDYMKLEKIRSYHDEIKSLMKLDHTNIIKIYDTFCDENYFVVVLEYCSGGDLDHFIKTNNSIRSPILISLVYQMVLSIYTCHSNNIAHHDIKPSNFFFDQYGNLKLADFGISQINECLLTKNYCGSFVYAAPELIAKKPYNPYKADIWSFGITICQLVTMTLPRPEDCKDQYFLRLKENYHNIASLIPECVRHVIERSLVMNPDDRADIEELFEYFKQFKLPKRKSQPHFNRNSAILSNICCWKHFTKTLATSL